jgi:hypothetical protein
VVVLPSVDLTALRADRLHSAYHLLPAGLLFGLIIDPEGEGNMFFKNVCELLPNYTALYVARLTRHCSSNTSMVSAGDLICPLISDIN